MLLVLEMFKYLKIKYIYIAIFSVIHNFSIVWYRLQFFLLGLRVTYLIML